MGKIRLLCKSVKANLRADFILYIFVMVGMIICVTMFFVFGRFYFSESKELHDKSFYQNRVSFLFTDSAKFKELSDDLLKSDLVSDIMMSCTRQSDFGENEIAYFQGSYRYPTDRVAAGNSNAKNGYFIMSERFRQRVFQKTKKNILLGSKINVGNNVVECGGIVLTNDFDLLVDKQIFFDIDSARQYKLTYVFEGGTSIAKVDELNASVSKKYTPIAIIRPEKTSKFTLWGLLFALGPNFLIIVVSMINHFFIYSFLLRRRLYTYSIFKLCGLSNIYTAAFLFSEILILFTISFIASIPIYLFSSALITDKAINISDLITQFSYAYPILLVINTLLFIIVAHGVISKNCIELYRESVVQ